MTGFWKFSCQNGKDRGIISLYVLYSLNKEPKSGYDILTEIEGKCKDWAPSKGTIYPLLNQFKDEGLIRVKKVGKRSKNVFELTEKGEELLSNIERDREDLREKFSQFRALFIDILGEEREDINRLLFDIKDLAINLSHERKEEVIEVLERCFADLRRIEED